MWEGEESCCLPPPPDSRQEPLDLQSAPHQADKLQPSKGEKQQPGETSYGTIFFPGLINRELCARATSKENAGVEAEE